MDVANQCISGNIACGVEWKTCIISDVYARAQNALTVRVRAVTVGEADPPPEGRSSLGVVVAGLEVEFSGSVLPVTDFTDVAQLEVLWSTNYDSVREMRHIHDCTHELVARRFWSDDHQLRGTGSLRRRIEYSCNRRRVSSRSLRECIAPVGRARPCQQTRTT